MSRIYLSWWLTTRTSETRTMRLSRFRIQESGFRIQEPGSGGNGASKLRALCDFNCPKGLENSEAQGSNPEGKPGRLTYDRRRTGVFDYPFCLRMSRLSAVTKASRLTSRPKQLRMFNSDGAFGLRAEKQLKDFLNLEAPFGSDDLRRANVLTCKTKSKGLNRVQMVITPQH